MQRLMKADSEIYIGEGRLLTDESGQVIIDDDGYVTAKNSLRLKGDTKQWMFFVFSNCASTNRACNDYYNNAKNISTQYCSTQIDVQYWFSMQQRSAGQLYREFSAVRLATAPLSSCEISE